MRGCAGALTAFGGGRFGDAASAGEAVEGKQAPVMQQEEAIGDVAHAGELVRRDDGRRGARESLTNEARPLRFVAPAEGVVDEQESTVALGLLVHPARFDQEGT